MNPDFVDLLRAFNAANVRFLVVGAYALALHGRPRATGDLDLWVDPTPENAAHVVQALTTFGAPLRDVATEDFSRAGIVYQIGVPPGRIDILTELTGVTFAEAWPGRVRRPFGDVDVDFIDATRSCATNVRPVAPGILAISRVWNSPRSRRARSRVKALSAD